ncbi:type II secretion system F family protein [Microbacterium sp.]|uniref:type II secretion system F family protein n=1 Tax=Microbacterium sp. TaxID=51671 RepID=UPI0028117247|nr:type II secretion system F family protein [Microbacterium sp.]
MRTLAVLLQAGARPLAAWRHVAEAGDAVASRVIGRVEAGAELVGAIEAEGGTWRDVAAAWEVATVVGAPLADVLRSLAEALHDAATADDDVRIALAEPVGTARLLLWLPFAGLLLGLALGFDTIGVLTTTPFGIGCVVAGVALVMVARWWTSRLVRRAQPDPGTPGIHAELVAVALAGGVAIPRALRLVDHSPAVLESDRRRTDAVLALSRAAGVPAGELLRAAAAQQRHEARVQGRIRAARLSSSLLLPLGACTLPAFLLLGVAPLMLSVISSTPLPL